MSQIVLTPTRIHAGIWEGVLSGADAPPVLEVRHLNKPVAGLAVTPVPDRPGDWLVRVPIPAELLCQGVQTFVVRDPAQDAALAHFTIVTGVSMEDDLRAEIGLLRAELDLLKKAFRRHCLETAA